MSGHPPGYEKRDVNLPASIVVGVISLGFILGSILILDCYFYGYIAKLEDRNARQVSYELQAEIDHAASKLEKPSTSKDADGKTIFAIPVNDGIEVFAKEEAERKGKSAK